MSIAPLILEFFYYTRIVTIIQVTTGNCATVHITFICSKLFVETDHLCSQKHCRYFYALCRENRDRN